LSGAFGGRGQGGYAGSMSRLLFALCLSLVAFGSATAAGRPDAWRDDKSGAELAFPRSGQAQAIWDGAICWSQCGASTTWTLVGCLERDAQGRCLKHADAGDRACQRLCRTRGGAFLPIDTLFPLGD